MYILQHLPFPYNIGSGIQTFKVICTKLIICGNILEYHQQNSTTNNPSQLFIHPLARPRLTVDPTPLSQSSHVDTNQSCTILHIHLTATIRLLLTLSSCQWQLDTRNADSANELPEGNIGTKCRPANVIVQP